MTWFLIAHKPAWSLASCLPINAEDVAIKNTAFKQGLEIEKQNFEDR